jgi:LysR family transcriptional regulator, glycine cleavage system transcriptional activator
MQKDTRRLPPLDRIVVFDAAARHLSFTKAAAERFLTQSAVSRQIAALEGDLGVPLFKRSHRTLALTEPGRRLAVAAANALAELRDAVSAIRNPTRREVLSLTTTPGLASLWLIPRLAGFTQAHPGVDVRIDASYGVRGLAAEGFDIAIRYGPTGSAAGTPLFEESVLPLCAPALLKRGAGLKHASDLRHHTLLQVSGGSGSGMPLEWPSWFAAMGVPDVEPASVLSFTSYDSAVQAALAGQGVVLGRRPLIDDSACWWRLSSARRPRQGASSWWSSPVRRSARQPAHWPAGYLTKRGARADRVGLTPPLNCAAAMPRRTHRS